MEKYAIGFFGRSGVRGRAPTQSAGLLRQSPPLAREVSEPAATTTSKSENRPSLPETTQTSLPSSPETIPLPHPEKPGVNSGGQTEKEPTGVSEKLRSTWVSRASDKLKENVLYFLGREAGGPLEGQQFFSTQGVKKRISHKEFEQLFREEFKKRLAEARSSKETLSREDYQKIYREAWQSVEKRLETEGKVYGALNTIRAWALEPWFYPTGPGAKLKATVLSPVDFFWNRLLDIPGRTFNKLNRTPGLHTLLLALRQLTLPVVRGVPAALSLPVAEVAGRLLAAGVSLGARNIPGTSLPANIARKVLEYGLATPLRYTGRGVDYIGKALLGYMLYDFLTSGSRFNPLRLMMSEGLRDAVNEKIDEVNIFPIAKVKPGVDSNQPLSEKDIELTTHNPFKGPAAPILNELERSKSQIPTQVVNAIKNPWIKDLITSALEYSANTALTSEYRANNKQQKENKADVKGFLKDIRDATVVPTTKLIPEKLISETEETKKDKTENKDIATEDILSELLGVKIDKNKKTNLPQEIIEKTLNHFKENPERIFNNPASGLFTATAMSLLADPGIYQSRLASQLSESLRRLGTTIHPSGGVSPIRDFQQVRQQLADIQSINEKIQEQLQTVGLEPVDPLKNKSLSDQLTQQLRKLTTPVVDTTGETLQELDQSLQHIQNRIHDWHDSLNTSWTQLGQNVRDQLPSLIHNPVRFFSQKLQELPVTDKTGDLLKSLQSGETIKQKTIGRLNQLLEIQPDDTPARQRVKNLIRQRVQDRIQAHQFSEIVDESQILSDLVADFKKSIPELHALEQKLEEHNVQKTLANHQDLLEKAEQITSLLPKQSPLRKQLEQLLQEDHASRKLTRLSHILGASDYNTAAQLMALTPEARVVTQALAGLVDRVNQHVFSRHWQQEQAGDHYTPWGTQAFRINAYSRLLKDLHNKYLKSSPHDEEKQLFNLFNDLTAPKQQDDITQFLTGMKDIILALGILEPDKFKEIMKSTMSNQNVIDDIYNVVQSVVKNQIYSRIPFQFTK